MLEGRRRHPPAVISLSGGMDSCVCAALAAQTHDIYALHISYGQRTEARELESARAVAEAVGAKRFLHLRLGLFREIGGSALTDTSIAVPDAPAAPDPSSMGAPDGGPGGAQGQLHGDDIPVTYVPFRNAHFLAAAVSWAETLGARTVSIGAVEPDSSGYPDCRPAYYEAFQKVVDMGTRNGALGDGADPEKRIRIETPLIAMRKAEIVRLGLELGAPLHLTWSCYQGERVACGVCDSCVLRLRAFAEAGQPDRIPYASQR